MVTLHPNYVRKIAQSYKLLRSGEYADPKVLQALHSASDRCLRAHMRAELQLSQDVRLPLSTVLMLLEYVHSETASRLATKPSLLVRLRSRLAGLLVS